MIPSMEQQIRAAAAQANEERLCAYLRTVRAQAVKAPERRTRMDRLALRLADARPGMTVRDIAAEHPDYVQKAWQVRLHHLVHSGLLDVLPPLERRRHRNGVLPNRHVITERGRAMLATLDALAAASETPPATTTEH